MSKVCLVKDGVLKIIELPKFAGICSNTVSITDIPESVILLEEVCEQYQIVENKYVFYVAKGEQYIYNLSSGEIRKLDLEEVGYDNYYNSFCRCLGNYHVIEYSSKELIKAIYIIELDEWVVAIPGANFEYVYDDDGKERYIYERINSTLMGIIGIIIVEDFEHFRCSYGNSLEIFNKFSEKCIIERDCMNNIVTFYYFDSYYDCCGSLKDNYYTKISVSQKGNCLVSKLIGNYKYIVETNLEGEIIAFFDCVSNVKLFTRKSNNLLRFEIYDCKINVRNKAMPVIFEEDKSTHKIYSIYNVFTNELIVANFGHHFQFTKNENGLKIVELDLNNKKVEKHFLKF